MLTLALYLGDIKLPDQTGDKTDGWVLFIFNTLWKRLFLQWCEYLCQSLYLISKVSGEASVSGLKTSLLLPHSPCVFLNCCCWEICLSVLRGTEVRVMAEVGAEEITTSYWSLANKLGQDWLIKSESKHRHWFAHFSKSADFSHRKRSRKYKTETKIFYI